ncbi:hypothetical protein JGH11_19510, partial [Dysgonomonas sp. Marseille-P4677]|uniref:hypothetical protein n=1 Tax=Dysgonomonas sp. Marseille-P4677 TaxID=2364790 RepID=UPI001911490D
MRTLLFNFILLVFLQSCIKLQDNNYYSCLDLKEITSERNFIGNNGWYFQRGHILIDTLEAYKGKASLRLIPTPYDGIKQASAFFYTNMTEIDGDTIIFSGEYKLRNVINGKIVIRIEQDNNSGKIRKDSIIIDEYTKINEWLDFSIRIPLNENIIESFFYIDVIGNMDCYINNCKINIDEHPIEKFICAKYEAEDNNE